MDRYDALALNLGGLVNLGGGSRFLCSHSWFWAPNYHSQSSSPVRVMWGEEKVKPGR